VKSDGMSLSREEVSPASGAAYTVRERLNANDRVTVVSPSDQFVFAPSLVWAVLGRPLVHSTFALEPALKRKGIDFVRSQVWSVQPADRTVQTDGGELRYDRLVIATGGHPDSLTIPGLAGEGRAASWVVGVDSATEAATVIRRLSANPGPLVVGAAQGASYISGAYELALALHLALRKDRIRDLVPMTFAYIRAISRRTWFRSIRRPREIGGAFSRSAT